jgi:acylphosphatase
MDVYKQIYISGRVQGVFFRDSTRQKANELKLSGGVRNLGDGRVEVQVAGDEADVQTLIKWLKIGPKFAKVSTIEVIDCPIDSLEQIQNGRFEVWTTR